MRIIDKLIIHCSATFPGQDVGVREIDAWHRARGFNGIGYHYVIRLDGTLENGRRIALAGAHCQGQNARSIGICYVGGLDVKGNPADTRTPGQKKTLRKLIERLESYYRCDIYGHRDFARKACPCFDAHSEYEEIYKKYHTDMFAADKYS